MGLDGLFSALLPSSSMAGGTRSLNPSPAGLLTMRRTYCALTASRALAAAPTMAFCCAFAWSTSRFAARFSRTCSGVNPDGNAALHIGHVLKSCSLHRTKQHRWNTWLQVVVNNTHFGSTSVVWFSFPSVSFASPDVPSSSSPLPSSPLAPASFSPASPKKSHRFPERSRSNGE